LTAYYVERIKRYGTEATRTEVAKGEARIAEIGKKVTELQAMEDANYGFEGQTPKEIRLEDPSPEWMAKLKSRTEATDDSMARMQKEMRQIDDTMARMQKAERESNAETKEARRLVDEQIARDRRLASRAESLARRPRWVSANRHGCRRCRRSRSAAPCHPTSISGGSLPIS